MSRYDGMMGRKEWSLKMQERYAVPVYQHYWDISAEDIIEVDAAAASESVAERMDKMGVDKIVDPETGKREVAQRFRNQSEYEGKILDPDFSIRITTYNDAKTEYDKQMNAHRNGGEVPSVYAFGIAAGTTFRESLRRGFKSFHFIDWKRFLDLFDRNRIKPCGASKNDDGETEGLYIPLEEIRQTGAMETEIAGDVLSSAWATGETSSDFPTAPGVRTTGQLNLRDFGGSR